MVFEVVLENIEEVMIAEKYGAKRVELCSALDLGGVTPSQAIIESCVSNTNCEVHVMIRPRSGGFIYNNNEIAIMKKDILLCQKVGCKGVVFGVVSEDKNIDIYKTNVLVDYSNTLGLEVTFHRAVDFTDNIFKSVEQLIQLNTTRILTSGTGKTVNEGIETIKQLYNSYQNQIQIMAGGGVNVVNSKALFAIGLDAIHFNIRKEKIIQSNTLMGLEYEIDEEKIKKINSLLN